MKTVTIKGKDWNYTDFVTYALSHDIDEFVRASISLPYYDDFSGMVKHDCAPMWILWLADKAGHRIHELEKYLTTDVMWLCRYAFRFKERLVKFEKCLTTDPIAFHEYFLFFNVRRPDLESCLFRWPYWMCKYAINVARERTPELEHCLEDGSKDQKEYCEHFKIKPKDLQREL